MYMILPLYPALYLVTKVTDNSANVQTKSLMKNAKLRAVLINIIPQNMNIFKYILNMLKAIT